MKITFTRYYRFRTEKEWIQPPEIPLFGGKASQREIQGMLNQHYLLASPPPKFQGNLKDFQFLDAQLPNAIIRLLYHKSEVIQAVDRPFEQSSRIKVHGNGLTGSMKTPL